MEFLAEYGFFVKYEVVSRMFFESTRSVCCGDRLHFDRAFAGWSRMGAAFGLARAIIVHLLRLYVSDIGESSGGCSLASEL